jgi:hypothetical protein
MAPEDKRVLLQAVIDVDGSVRHATYAGGPAQLAPPAIEALQTRRATAARINGEPVASSMLLEVGFK